LLIWCLQYLVHYQTMDTSMTQWKEVNNGLLYWLESNHHGVQKIQISLSYWKWHVNYTPAPRRRRGVYCFTSARLSVRPSVRPRYFSSHLSQ
jgi:hypothetical protein